MQNVGTKPGLTWEKRVYHDKLVRFWQALKKSLGDNPFRIAARQGISVTFHDHASVFEGDLQRPLYSQFRPEEFAIDIYEEPLSEFWEALFPGQAPHLKYHYACWRELWHFWEYTRFAPLKFELGNAWLVTIETFSKQSYLDREYLAQYFAAIATGTIRQDD